jgi:hypothetical protein
MFPVPIRTPRLQTLIYLYWGDQIFEGGMGATRSTHCIDEKSIKKLDQKTSKKYTTG